MTISISTGQGESIVRLPARITCHEDFVRSILKIRAHSGKKGGEAASRTDYIEAVYYLLAWLVGDAGKGFGSERLHTARIEINLCRRHSENLGLGEYVAGCIRMVGVPCKRLPDKVSDPSEPHGSFRWLSGFSQVIGWMHATCLGLDWNQRTSYYPVKMDWLLSAPPECRMWFIRGLADSDGSVHFRHKSAEIVTSPNTTLIRDILASLHVHNVLDFSKGCGRISISGQTAAEIQIFNPRVPTMHLHNSCDIAGICPNGERMAKQLAAAGVSVRDTIIDFSGKQVNQCTLSCGAREGGASTPGSDPLGFSVGLVEHGRWPKKWTPVMLDFMHAHSLDAKR